MEKDIHMTYTIHQRLGRSHTINHVGERETSGIDNILCLV